MRRWSGLLWQCAPWSVRFQKRNFGCDNAIQEEFIKRLLFIGFAACAFALAPARARVSYARGNAKCSLGATDTTSKSTDTVLLGVITAVVAITTAGVEATTMVGIIAIGDF